MTDQNRKRRAPSSRSDGYVRIPSDDVDSNLADLQQKFYSPQGSDAVSRQSSLVLPSLIKQEKRFFSLVAAGNLEALKEFLQENIGLRLNCIDFKGDTALRIAVRAHNEEMVRFLLAQRAVTVSDCALHAVDEDQEVILEMLLDKMAASDPSLEFKGCPRSPNFPDYLTPLMLAAQCGKHELIKILLERGHRIEHPHHPRCTCDACVANLSKERGLKAANERLSVYRAITNPAYISQTSIDPILTAFQLHRELQHWASIKLQFRVAYVELAREVRAFAVDLIGCCRDSQEVERVLNLRAGCEFAGQVHFPRLTIAMEYNQKEFVAHPNSQEVLDAAWRGDWHEWKRRSEPMKLLTIFPRIVKLPFVMLMCMVAPTSTTVKFHSLPINKMLNSIASYLVFLVLVFIESNQDKTNQKRGPPQSGVEIILVVYVIGYIWSSTKLCMRLGIRRFAIIPANWYDIIMEGLYLTAISFWLAAYLDVRYSDREELPRKYWDHLDPTLLAEGFFTVATILAFGRLLILMQLNLHLGPLQVALGKMGKDIVKFFALISLTLLAFTAGLCRFYQNYDGMVQIDEETGTKTEQVSSFVSVESTLKTLFWAIFCMSPIESADVVIENLEAINSTETLTNKHDFTEAVGHICFALYSMLIVFVIVNMMIAGLCNTMQKVIDNVNVEWTFGRTAVYLAYMSQSTLPPPFNLVPTASGFLSVCGWCSTCVKPTATKKSKFSFKHCCYVELDEMEGDNPAPELMAVLYQRYLQQREKNLTWSQTSKYLGD